MNTKNKLSWEYFQKTNMGDPITCKLNENPSIYDFPKLNTLWNQLYTMYYYTIPLSKNQKDQYLLLYVQVIRPTIWTTEYNTTESGSNTQF